MKYEDYKYTSSNLWVETYIKSLNLIGANDTKRAIEIANEAVDGYLEKMKEL